MAKRHLALFSWITVLQLALTGMGSIDVQAETIRKACGEKPPMLRSINQKILSECRV